MRDVIDWLGRLGLVQRSEPSSPELWALAVAAMRDQGIGEQSARAFVGLCLKQWDERHVRQAVTCALGKADFKAYCRKVLERKPPKRQTVAQLELLADTKVDREAARASYAANRARLQAVLKR